MRWERFEKLKASQLYEPNKLAYNIVIESFLPCLHTVNKSLQLS